MKFTELLAHISSVYKDRSRKFQVLATRFYLGAETQEDLERQAKPIPIHGDYMANPIITYGEVMEIIRNR